MSIIIKDNLKGMVFPPYIIHGDSLEALMGMGEGTADLALIDPPYFDYKTGHRKDKGGKLSQSLVQQDRADQLRTVEECIRVLKMDRTFWFFTNWQEAWWFQAKFMPRGLIRNQIIWNKGNWTAGDLEGSLGNMYEVIFLGVKGQWKLKDKRLNDLEDWMIPRVGTNRVHPTEKPVELYARIIELTTEPGDIIIDPYVGSGASAEAALRTGRNYVGWEIDKGYYDVDILRIQRCLEEAK